MPRPKPVEELKPRGVRMTDAEYLKFKEWGGADRLRLMFKMQPAGYFAVFQKPEYNKADATFIKRKRERND
jgi:hypothetical protein